MLNESICCVLLHLHLKLGNIAQIFFSRPFQLPVRKIRNTIIIWPFILPTIYAASLNKSQNFIKSSLLYF